jgi:mannose-1-phosphate guanylyltransferase
MLIEKVSLPTFRPRRWCVILAGGDGRRLLPVTRQITGDERPKQFCALTGGETLLDQTRRRVARIVPKDQTLLVLTRTHEPFYSSQVAGTDVRLVVAQPYNHGTAPAIAWSLIRLRQMDPDGLVAFFPSDHHFDDDDAFVASIESAFLHAESDAGRVVLLGVTPDAPEQSYGWIEPGERLASSGVFEVRRFWEKPPRKIASRLMRNGGLWNSFIMIGRVSAFLGLVRKTLPSLLMALESSDDEALSGVYSSIPAADFSTDVLAACPAALSVLRAPAVGWSDLGEPQRVFSVIKSQELALAAAR